MILLLANVLWSLHRIWNHEEATLLNSFDNHDFPDKGISKLCLVNELDDSLLLAASCNFFYCLILYLLFSNIQNIKYQGILMQLTETFGFGKTSLSRVNRSLSLHSLQFMVINLVWGVWMQLLIGNSNVVIWYIVSFIMLWNVWCLPVPYHCPKIELFLLSYCDVNDFYGVVPCYFNAFTSMHRVRYHQSCCGILIKSSLLILYPQHQIAVSQHW